MGFEIVSPVNRRIFRVATLLSGVAMQEQRVNTDDGIWIGGLYFLPPARGTYDLQILATDEQGCTGASAALSVTVQ